MSYTLALTDVPDDKVRRQIAAPLIEYNQSRGGPDHYQPLIVTLKNAQGTVEGGLWGYTNYSWLFVQLLVVPETLRRSGFGRRLMAAAEEEAMRRGCLNAWLDTHEFQAPGFYEKLGYEVFGKLPDYPPGFARIFLTKRLICVTPAQASAAHSGPRSPGTG
jgi:GNAT superfamily N-acetyltransferase